MKNKFISTIITTFILLQITMPIFAEDSIYVWNNSAAITTDIAAVQTEQNFLKLTSGSAILIEQNTGKVLYEHNIHQQLFPASVTKVMTILLIMEDLDSGKITLQDKVGCSDNAANMGGSQIWLQQTENLTVDEMLKAICVVSANDCSVAMAEYLAGSEEAFVLRMNERAKELGMNDTTFKNCHGIDAEGHVTSAYDIALMSKELLTNHPTITKYTTIWMDTLRDGKSSLVNTNKLLRNYKGITGLKTGSTSSALFNLSASATRDDFSLIAVIMKGETSDIRFSEAKKLLDYGFSAYTYKELGKKNTAIKTVEINKGVEHNLDILYGEAGGVVVKKGEENGIQENILLDENIVAPVNKDDKVGEVIYKLNDVEIGKANLIASKTIKKMTLMNMTTHIYELWFNLNR